VTAALYRPFIDAMLLKEIGGLSRRAGPYLLRVAYVGLLAGVLYLFQQSLFSQGSFVSPSEYAALGRGLFTGLVALQMVFLTLAAGGIAADLLLREVRSGMLQILLLSPLSHWRIVFGKWKAAVAQCLALQLCGAPILAVCVYLGGAAPWDFAWTTALTFALVAFSAAASLYGAITLGSLPRAIGQGVMLLVVSAVPFLLFVAGAALVGAGAWAFVPATYLHPLLALFGPSLSPQLGDAAAYGWIGATLTTLVFTRWILFAAAGHLSRAETAGALLTARTSSPEAILSRLDPATERRAVWKNFPLLWKEVATRPALQVGYVQRIKAFIVLGLALWYSRAVDPVVGVIVAAIPCLLLALVNGAWTFSAERSRRTIEVLLSTPLSAARLVGAKLTAAVASPEPFCLLTLALIVLATAADDGSRFLLATAALGIFLSFAVTLAAAHSLYFRTFRSAFAVSLGWVSALLLATPYLIEGTAGVFELGLAAIHPGELIKHLTDPQYHVLESEVLAAFQIYALLYGTATVFLGILLLFGLRNRACQP